MTFARYITFVSHSDSVEELPGSLLCVLQDVGVEVGPRIVTEDEGWGISFRHDGADYLFCSRFDMGSEPLECMGWIERKRGFLAAIFRPRETQHRELEPVIQTALARLPTVRDPVWHSADEDDAA